MPGTVVKCIHISEEGF
jgi:hypothetical protein